MQHTVLLPLPKPPCTTVQGSAVWHSSQEEALASVPTLAVEIKNRCEPCIRSPAPPARNSSFRCCCRCRTRHSAEVQRWCTAVQWHHRLAPAPVLGHHVWQAKHDAQAHHDQDGHKALHTKAVVADSVPVCSSKVTEYAGHQRVLPVARAAQGVAVASSTGACSANSA